MLGAKHSRALSLDTKIKIKYRTERIDIKSERINIKSERIFMKSEMFDTSEASNN